MAEEARAQEVPLVGSSAAGRAVVAQRKAPGKAEPKASIWNMQLGSGKPNAYKLGIVVGNCKRRYG